MITIKRSVLNRLNSFLNLPDNILRFGAIDGSTIWDVFGKDGFEVIMNKVPEEAKNWPEFHQAMDRWTPANLTPFLIMKSVIGKMIAEGEIVVLD